MKKLILFTLIILGTLAWTKKAQSIPSNDFERFLIEAGYDKNGNKTLEKDELDAIVALDCSARGLTNLNGIEKLTNLEVLNASNNQLTSVTLANKVLVEINLSNNKLSYLNIAGCENLAGGYAKFDARNNPNLRCIIVSTRNQLGATKVYKQNWLKDDNTKFDTNCN